MEDFIPWVRPELSRPSASEEEEEEEEMTGLLDRYATRKRKRQEVAKREADRAEGPDRPPTDGGSEMQAIMIPSSLEMGSNDQIGFGGNHLWGAKGGYSNSSGTISGPPS